MNELNEMRAKAEASPFLHKLFHTTALLAAVKSWSTIRPSQDQDMCMASFKQSPALAHQTSQTK